MKIAITDANIFIDLIKLGLLDCLFKLGIEIHTTREVFDQLNHSQKIVVEGFISDSNLFVYVFTYEELQEIDAIPFPPGLELADRTVFYYSTKTKAIVLSGDRKLRIFCSSKMIEVKGILWLFDEFVEKQLITRTVAFEKLEHLISFNDRLPMDECRKRMSRWKSF